MRALSAYPTLLRVGFASALAYRAEVLVWMLTTTMPLVSMALWTAVAEVAPVGRFGPGQFVGYFLSALVVRQVTGSWLVWSMNADIRQGTLSQRLLKPVHPLWSYSAENLSALPLRALLCVPVLLLMVVGGQLTTDPWLVAIGIASLVGAWLINFFSMAAIGALAFFLESSTSIFELWMISFMLLSGYIVPLELFPGWVGAVAWVLPFRYTLGYPVEVIVGMTDYRYALEGLAMQWAWAAACALLAILMFRAGIRRFAAFGG